MSGKPVQQLTPFGHALAGALGGVFSTAVVYPLDTVKTRIQASTATGKERAKLSMTSIVQKILEEDGFWTFYNGFSATMLNTFSMQYAYFFFYSFVRGSYIKRLSSKLPKGSKAPPLSTAAELIVGAIAGALAQIFTIPVSVIATRQQLAHPSHPHAQNKAEKGKAPAPPLDEGNIADSYVAVSDETAQTSASTSTVTAPQRLVEEPETQEEPDNSFFGVAKQIISEDGVTGLWLGLKPGLVLTVNPAITYGVFERVKSAVLAAKEKAGRSPKLTPVQAFVVGALCKTLATVVTYPYIMAKVRIQAGEVEADELPAPATSSGKQHAHHIGALSLLAKVLKKDGFVGWYQGMSAQITKAVLAQALLFMSKDRFERYALVLMNIYYRMLHS